MGTLGEHGDTDGLTGTFGHNNSTADGLVGLTGVNAELNSHVDGFVELGVGAGLDGFESLQNRIVLGKIVLGGVGFNALGKFGCHLTDPPP